MKSVKTTLLTINILLILISYSSAQAPRQGAKITRNIPTDLNNLLPAGKFQADIMNGVKQSDKFKEISIKFQKGIQQNYLWYVEYIKEHEGKVPIPYHSNFGISKEEYTSLKTLLNEVEIISTGKTPITILKKKGVISFKADDRLKILDYVKISPDSNYVIIGDYKLTFQDTINVKTNKNGLKSKWKGYRWEYSLPDDLNIDMLKDLANLTFKHYKCSIGRLERNGKTLFKIRGREYKDGIKEINFEMVLMF